MQLSAPRHHIPNTLTAGRILLTPCLLLLITVPTAAGQFGAVFLFVTASLSDYYDGKLARSLGVRSRLGQFLDPLADKILVLGTFSMLALYEPQAVPAWAVVVIAARDLFVTALRTWSESRGQTLRTFRVAKAKTLSQLAFLFGMLVLRAATHVPYLSNGATWLLRESAFPYAVLLAVLALTVGTGLLYAVASRQESVG